MKLKNFKNNKIFILSSSKKKIKIYFYFKNIKPRLYALCAYNTHTGEISIINTFKYSNIQLLNLSDIRLIVFNYWSRKNKNIKYLYLNKIIFRKIKKFKKLCYNYYVEQLKQKI